MKIEDDGIEPTAIQKIIVGAIVISSAVVINLGIVYAIVKVVKLAWGE